MIFVVSIPLLLWFASALAGLLRGRADDTARMAIGIVVGAVSVSVSLAANAIAWSMALPFVLQKPLSESASDDLIRVVYIGTFLAGLIGFAALGAALLAFGLAARTTCPPWLSRSAVVVGALTVAAGAIAVASADGALAVGLVFALVGIWVLAAGISLARRTSTVAA